jgi:hypothetical protein
VSLDQLASSSTYEEGPLLRFSFFFFWTDPKVHNKLQPLLEAEHGFLKYTRLLFLKQHWFIQNISSAFSTGDGGSEEVIAFATAVLKHNKNKKFEPGLVVHICNPSTQKSEVGGL